MDVTAGKYKILAPEAIYRRENTSVTFQGPRTDPPRVVRGGSTTAYNPLVLQRIQGEFHIKTMRGRRFDAKDLKPILEAFDKSERAPGN